MSTSRTSGTSSTSGSSRAGGSGRTGRTSKAAKDSPPVVVRSEPTPETAVDIAAAVRAGTLSPLETVATSIRRIVAHDGRLGAFQVVRARAATDEAREAAGRKDLKTLPLAGVPVAVKDNIAVAGEPMRSGSAATDATPRTYDHVVVERLRAAGAIVVGLTRVPELCIFGATDSSYGITHNPWDRSRTPGGSSGGSAAAVAGGDGAGGARQRRHGLDPDPGRLLRGGRDQAGLRRRPVGSGRQRLVRHGRERPAGDDGRRRRAGAVGDGRAPASWPSWSSRTGRCGSPVSSRPADHGVTRGHRAPARAWCAPRGCSSAAGHIISGRPALRGEPGCRSWPAGSAVRRSTRRAWTATLLDPAVRAHVRVGDQVRRRGTGHVTRDRESRPDGHGRVLRRSHDLLLTPVLAAPPIAAARWGTRPWPRVVAANVRFAPYPAPWNMLQYPAASVPAGIHPAVGTPLAVQLVAPDGGEPLHPRAWPRRSSGSRPGGVWPRATERPGSAVVDPGILTVVRSGRPLHPAGLRHHQGPEQRQRGDDRPQERDLEGRGVGEPPGDQRPAEGAGVRGHLVAGHGRAAAAADDVADDGRAGGRRAAPSRPRTAPCRAGTAGAPPVNASTSPAGERERRAPRAGTAGGRAGRRPPTGRQEHHRLRRPPRRTGRRRSTSGDSSRLSRRTAGRATTRTPEHRPAVREVVDQRGPVRRAAQRRRGTGWVRGRCRRPPRARAAEARAR